MSLCAPASFLACETLVDDAVDLHESPMGLGLDFEALPAPVPRSLVPVPDLARLVKKGTTTVGLLCRDGVVLAADSRASLGNYVASASVQKIMPISERLAGTMAGGAADCQFWVRWLGMQLRLRELKYGEEVSIRALARIYASVTRSYRGYGLVIGSMIAGRDRHGFHLYRVDSEGSCTQVERNSDGSGSVFAYGVLDAGWHRGMSVAEGVEVARRAVFHATHRDAYSGSVINVFTITADAAGFVSRDENPTLYQRYLEAGELGTQKSP